MSRQVFYQRQTLTADQVQMSIVDGVHHVHSFFSRSIIPTNGSIGMAWFEASQFAPGASKSYNFQFRVNGTLTGDIAEIEGATQQKTFLDDWIPVSAGNTVDIEINKVGSPSNQLFFSYLMWKPDIENESLFMGTCTGALTVTQNVDEFIGMAGNIPAVRTVLNTSEIVISTPGTLKKLSAEIATGPGASANRQFSVMVGGVKKFTITMTGSETTGNNTGTFAVVAGDKVTFVASTTTAGIAPAANAWCTMGCVFVPTNTGEWIIPLSSTTSLPASNANRRLALYNGQSNWSGAQAANRKRLRGDVEFLNMYCLLLTAPGTGNTRPFVFRQGTTAKISATISGTATTANQSTTVAIIEGQNYDVQVSGTSTPAASLATVSLTARFKDRVANPFPGNIL